MALTSRRRRLAPIANNDAGGRLSGDAYLTLMRQLDLDHRGMAAALGVTKWCSIAWRTGRRNIPPIAERAIRGLFLQRMAGAPALDEADRLIAAARRKFP